MAKTEMGAETSRLLVRCPGAYSPAMSDKPTALLDRLKACQRDLILAAAEIDALPAASVLLQIAELENAIAAVEAVTSEETARRG